ncbi:MAG: sulfotransferase [Rhodospirillaceae bacterium]
MGAKRRSSNTALSSANASLTLLKDGKPKQALDHAEQALKDAPAHPALWQVIGLAALKLGQAEKSAAALAASLSAKAEQPGIWEIYGGVLETLERHEDALNAYTQATRYFPNTPDSYRLQGAILQTLMRFDAAIAAYAKSLSLNPKQPETWLHKGTLEFTTGNNTAAAQSFAQALSYDTNLAKAWRGQGAIRAEQGNREAAIEDFRKAIALDPRDAATHRQLASVLWEMHHVDQADVLFQKSLALDPECAATLASMAAMYEQTNRLEEAGAAADQALAKDSHNTLAQIVKATLARRAGKNDVALQALTQLSATVDTLTEREAVAFELARLHDKLGQTEEAFKHFSTGNAAQIQSPAGQRINHKKYIAQITREAELLETAAPLHHPSTPPIDEPADPVFLIGFPRSGTTLLDQVLNSHTDVAVMEERPPLVQVHERLTALELKSGTPFTRLDEEQRQAARRYYFDMARTFVPDLDNRLFVDKYPLSTAKIRIIKLLFPEARIIFALRHPCDVVLSCFMQRFTLNMAMTHFTSLSGATNLYALVMGLWIKHHAALKFKVHTIRYEDVVQDFEAQIKGVLTFLGLPWDEAVLSFHKHARQRHLRTASSSQVTQPLYTSALGRWKKYATHLEPHMRTLQPFIKEFGYDSDISEGN